MIGGGRDFPSATNRYTPFVCILKFHNSSRMPLFLFWKSEHVKYPPIMAFMKETESKFKRHVYCSVFITSCQLCHKNIDFLVKVIYVKYVYSASCLMFDAIPFICDIYVYSSPIYTCQILGIYGIYAQFQEHI